MGERDLSFAEATAIIGDRIGRPELQYVQFPYDAFAASLAEAGFSQDVAELFAGMARAVNEGRMTPHETRDAANTTATRFETFCRRGAGRGLQRCFDRGRAGHSWTPPRFRPGRSAAQGRVTRTGGSLLLALECLPGLSLPVLGPAYVDPDLVQAPPGVGELLV